MVIHLQTTGEVDGCRYQAFALINQMTTSQTRLTTSPIAALVNRAVPLTFTVIQRILRHSTVATTQSHYIKTASRDAIAAMKQFFEALLCSTFAPDGDVKAKGSVQ